VEIIQGKKVHKLAFCGKMGAGKSVAIVSSLDCLADLYGGDNVIGYSIKFANPLYQSMLAFHRMTKGQSERTFLQRLGDLARREFGDDIMEKIFSENVGGVITNKLPIVSQEHVLISCDDVRFLNEYKLVKSLGFTVIRVDAPDEIRKQRLGDAYTNVNHRSEVELALFSPDYVIQNDKNEPFLETFDAGLKHLLGEIKFFAG
jgi:hypothetical protein